VKPLGWIRFRRGHCVVPPGAISVFRRRGRDQNLLLSLPQEGSSSQQEGSCLLLRKRTIPEPNCYGLHMRCTPQSQVLYAWSPAGGMIVEGCRNLRRQGLARGSRSLVVSPWGILFLVPSCLSLYFLSAMKGTALP
jgi:hypothetical protein